MAQRRYRSWRNHGNIYTEVGEIEQIRIHGLTYGSERPAVLLENSFRVFIDLWYLTDNAFAFQRARISAAPGGSF